MLRDGAVQMLSEVLQKCLDAANLDPKVFLENRNVSGKVTSVVSWCIPVFKSISLICDCRTHGQSISLPDRLATISWIISNLLSQPMILIL